jgi:predicted metalloprotease with PDZ domain
MPTIENRMENPTMGYVVVAVAVVAGMLAATALGQATCVKEEDGIGVAESPLATSNQPPHPARRWVLGVGAEPTPAGYRIRRVEHGSAAKCFGLEVGDRIITVNGRQVGEVGGRVIRLGDQLDRQGGPDGRVLLLIQDRRSERLVPLRVTLRHPSEHLGHWGSRTD